MNEKSKKYEFPYKVFCLTIGLYSLQISVKILKSCRKDVHFIRSNFRFKIKKICFKAFFLCYDINTRECESGNVVVDKVKAKTQFTGGWHDTLKFSIFLPCSLNKFHCCLKCLVKFPLIVKILVVPQICPKLSPVPLKLSCSFVTQNTSEAFKPVHFILTSKHQSIKSYCFFCTLL